MSVMGAKELSMMVTSLARLEYRPPESWLQAFAKASQEQMSSFGAQVRGLGCSSPEVKVMLLQLDTNGIGYVQMPVVQRH